MLSKCVQNQSINQSSLVDKRTSTGVIWSQDHQGEKEVEEEVVEERQKNITFC